MTTQAQGKGKKKNKEVTKVSLDEFNSFDAPHGHSVVSVKSGTGLDWAEAMADYEQTVDTHQIVVPAAPRAQRGPNVDIDSLSNDPPFKASVFNLPMSVEEKEIRERVFAGCNVVAVEVTKNSSTVEFETKQDLYEALCKDGATHKGRSFNVCPYGQYPREEFSDRGYGGRGDRYDRGSGGFGGSRMGDRYGERSGGFGRDRDGFGGGFNRAGGSGYGEGFHDGGNFRDQRSYTSGGGEPSEEVNNWRDRPTIRTTPQQPMSYNNGARQSPYMHSQQYQHPESYQQPRYNQHHNHPSIHSPPLSRPGFNNRPLDSLPRGPVEERPKLIVHKRNKPINIDDAAPAPRNEAIFGKAKPSSLPYQKMKEVEEKLSSVHIYDRKSSSQSASQVASQAVSRAGSQTGSQTGSQIDPQAGSQVDTQVNPPADPSVDPQCNV